MLQAFGQQDPLVAYKRQAFDFFEQFQVTFRKNVVYQIYHVLMQPQASFILHEGRLDAPPPESDGNGNGNGKGPSPAPISPALTDGHGNKAESTAHEAAAHAKRAPVAAGVKPSGKIGRNEPCFCGSGKKYKHCHGRT